jgi:hypothetical protein
MKIEFTIYIVTTPSGATAYDVCVDPAENITISIPGTEYEYEEEAHYLKDWCDENRLQYREIKESREV